MTPLDRTAPFQGFVPESGSRWLALDLEPGEAALVRVDQALLDVGVAVFDPHGRKQIDYDTPVGRRAPEALCIVAETGGRYRLMLTSFLGGGDVKVEVVRQGEAGEADRSCAQAQHLLMQLFDEVATRGLSDGLVPIYRRVVRLAVDGGERFLVELALREAGRALQDLDRSAEVPEVFAAALEQARRAGRSYLESDILSWWGLALLDQGDPEGASQRFEASLHEAQTVGDQRAETRALNHLALVEKLAGDPHREIERYRSLMPIWQDLGDLKSRSATLQRLAIAHRSLEHHEEALTQAREGLEIARRYGFEEREAGLLTTLGLTHFAAGELEVAVTRFQEALEKYRQLGLQDGEAIVLGRLGRALQAAGDVEAAEDSFRQLLALAENAGSEGNVAIAWTHLGCLAAQDGRPGVAIRRLDEADGRLRALADPKVRAHIAFCRALALHEEGELEAALEQVRSALATVETLRGTVRRTGHRYSPSWQWQDYAELEVKLLLEQARSQNRPEAVRRAFERADVARATNLLELVLEAEVGVRGRAGDELLRREREVQQALNRQRDRLLCGKYLGELTEEQDEQVEQRLRTLSLRLEEARAAIRTADPRYAELVDPQPVTVAELQRTLAPDTLLLSYVLGEEESHLFTVGREHLSVHSLPAQKQLEHHARGLYENLRSQALDPVQRELAAQALGRQLLPPGTIPQQTRRLVILADGLLHHLPFAVLPAPQLQGPSGGEARDELLFEAFEISYAPSASVMVSLLRRNGERLPAPRDVAVFADPIFAPEDDRWSGGLSRARPSALAGTVGTGASATRGITLSDLPQGPLPRLPWTGLEAESILARVPPQRRLGLLGWDATKEEVQSAPLDGYRVLHFATHALVDERFPELSGMVLSRLDRSGRRIDGDLQLHEIYNLDLGADLVVLSGCQTALGKRVRGDGLLSLTRGFLYAGASQVLVSLWPVDDQATAVLMTEFYRGLLEEGLAPSAALRQAQQHVAASEQWSDPYFWAAFVLQGAPSASSRF
ncbi:MAG: CHAT domain-containing tetratricopeptide repeat protein [Acidobacteriota bacterium]|nr:CHAT domain-containing tetratricopeptide repeat protein [Acidobacteriota bacterium]